MTKKTPTILPCCSTCKYHNEKLRRAEESCCLHHLGPRPDKDGVCLQWRGYENYAKLPEKPPTSPGQTDCQLLAERFRFTF